MADGRRAFHEELAEIVGDVVRLGALAVEAIEMGTAAFLDGDLTAAEHVIANDARLDDLMKSIESRTYILLALQQPMAGDLATRHP